MVTSAARAARLALLAAVISLIAGAVAWVMGAIIAIGGPWALLIGGVVFLIVIALIRRV